MEIGQILVGIADSAATARATAEAAKVKSPEPPKSLTPTQKALVSMMRENCGASILDSGGDSGRNWQRNRLAAFWNAPATTLRGRVYNGKCEIEMEHNVFHWLAEKVTYDPKMTARMNRMGKREGVSNLMLAQQFPDWLREKGHEIGGIYGEGDPVTENTYNSESLLSQVLQFVFFRCDGTDYVALCIHGGADVRGGYSGPKVFEVNDELGIFDGACGYIAPDHKEVNAKHAKEAKQGSLFPLQGTPDDVSWSTDDAYHWYFQGSCGGSYTAKQLDKLPAKEIESRDKWEKGTVCVLEDGTILCPFTGCTLRGGF